MMLLYKFPSFDFQPSLRQLESWLNMPIILVILTKLLRKEGLDQQTQEFSTVLLCGKSGEMTRKWMLRPLE